MRAGVRRYHGQLSLTQCLTPNGVCMSPFRKFQFTLARLFALVTACAVSLVAVLSGRLLIPENLVLVAPIVAGALLRAAFLPRWQRWQYALLAWGVVFVIVSLVLGEVASGFGSKIAGLWRLPGPPSQALSTGLWYAGLACAVSGSAAAVLGLYGSRGLPRVLCLISLVVLVLMVLWSAGGKWAGLSGARNQIEHWFLVPFVVLDSFPILYSLLPLIVMGTVIVLLFIRIDTLRVWLKGRDER